MGATTFSGPVRTGKDVGIAAQDTRGTLIASQFTTVASNTSGASDIVLPADSTITDIYLIVSATASANTQGMLVRVGNDTDADYFAQIKASAAGVYRPNRAVAPGLIRTIITTVAGNTSGASIHSPKSDAAITDMKLLVVATASNNSQGMLVRVGTSADAIFYANIKGSTRGVYMPGVVPNVAAASAKAWITPRTDSFYIDVTAATTATETDLFEAVLYITMADRTNATDITAASAASFITGTPATVQQQLYVDVTAANSAGQVDGFSGILVVEYIQRS